MCIRDRILSQPENFQETLLISSRFPGFPGGKNYSRISRSVRHPSSNSAEIFVQRTYPQVSSSYVYSFGSYCVDKQTHKQTPLKTSNILRYATTFGNNHVKLQYCGHPAVTDFQPDRLTSPPSHHHPTKYWVGWW